MYVKHLHYAAFQNVATYNDYMEKSSGVSASNNFGLNSGLTLYQGGRLRNTVKQQKLQAEAAGYDVEHQLKAAEESYQLVNEQFEAGIKNTVELLTEKNNLVIAMLAINYIQGITCSASLPRRSSRSSARRRPYPRSRSCFRSWSALRPACSSAGIRPEKPPASIRLTR